MSIISNFRSLNSFLLSSLTSKGTFIRCLPKSTSTTITDKNTEKPAPFIDPEEEESETNIPDRSQFLLELPEDPDIKEQVIERKRNKSRLLPQHQNFLHNRLPYDEPQSWIHQTLRYQRTQYGRYGLASKIDPRLCFPSKQEVVDRQEYEKIAYPLSVDEMMKINDEQKAEKARKIQDREDEIHKKMGKLDQWIRDLNDKIVKKEAEALAAKERKNRLVEEVRREFGFTLDTRDERFKEMLAQKEKEDRKKQKEAKRKLKEEKMLAKLQEKTAFAHGPQQQQQQSSVPDSKMSE